MYIAIYLPDDTLELDKSGFKTKKEAWKYVKTQLCLTCKKDLKKGWIQYEDEDSEKYNINHPQDTPCGCEWEVIKTKDFNKCDNIMDIMKYAGYKRIYTKDKNK